MPVRVGAVIRLDARDGSVSADLGGFSVTNLSVNGQLLTGTLNDGSGQVEAREPAPASDLHVHHIEVLG